MRMERYLIPANNVKQEESRRFMTGKYLHDPIQCPLMENVCRVLIKEANLLVELLILRAYA